MIKRIDPYQFDQPQFTPEQCDNFELADWIWNSHSWIESPAGYFKCEWCEKQTTNMQAIYHTDPLCLENPAIKKMIAK